MFKSLFSKENTMKVDINSLSKVLRGYEFHSVKNNEKFVIRKSYIIGGQEMHRAFVEFRKDGLYILDGWGAGVVKTTLEKLTTDLNRLFSGELFTKKDLLSLSFFLYKTW